ncbi:MAG: phosphatase PAP2 family protein [Bacteroidia bacterium]|nr:phosphatase PAP2 family protein [Bacteroidia bacterium]
MTGYWLQRQVVPLTPAQVNNLQLEDIPAFDRSAVTAWRPQVADVSDYWVLGSMLLPATLMLHPRMRQDAGAIALVYAETFSLNTGLTFLTKVAAGRTRPYAYLDSGTDIDLAALQLEPDARLSFYSGHTSSAAAISFMTARLYSLYFPNSRAKPYVWVAAAVVPGVAGWMRVRAGKHFPSDVVAGYLTGMAIGITVPSLHQSRVAKRLR